MGIVYLIGAGPGDYKLITVKGRECIEKADVIIYDYLADEKLLRWAREDAELIYAGKQCRNHTLKQHEINALLVEKGKEGKIVARLKGGDPLVFGRGGEEAQALREAGVSFEFVPGVTSAISAPAYAGIPVTQRGVATSFAIVTGHEDPTKEATGMRWEGLATAVDTVSFVMGVGNLPIIAENLIKYGRPKETPVAVIRWGTKAEQETVVSTLEHVVEDVNKAGLTSPAIIIVGEVVSLREQLRWFDTKPLFGKTVVVTRARAQASELTARLEALGANVVEAPAIRTAALPLGEFETTCLQNLRAYHTLVFTSAQGVQYFFKALQSLQLDVRALGGAMICAIGSATAKALADKGLHADIIPANYQGEAVVEALGPVVPTGAKVLLIQPKKARHVIPEGLKSMGLAVEIVRLYETLPSTAGASYLRQVLEDGKADYVTFTSSSTVENTLEMLGEQGQSLLGQSKIVCIGPITAATCVEKGITPSLVGENFTIPAMVELIKEDAQVIG